jgi:hypothetical protein
MTAKFTLEFLHNPVSTVLRVRQVTLKYSNINTLQINEFCCLDSPLWVSITPLFGSLHKCFIYVCCDSAWKLTRGGLGRGCQVMKVKQGWVGVPPSPWLFTQEERLVPTCAGPPAFAVFLLRLSSCHLSTAHHVQRCYAQIAGSRNDVGRALIRTWRQSRTPVDNVYFPNVFFANFDSSLNMTFIHCPTDMEGSWKFV